MQAFHNSISIEAPRELGAGIFVAHRARDDRMVIGQRAMVAGAGRGIDAQTPLFMGGVTRLAISALVLKLARAGALDLDSALSQYADPRICGALHVRAGVDRTEQITIAMLLNHRSGLGDPFPVPPGGRGFDRPGGDEGFTLHEAMRDMRGREAVFNPGIGKRARVSMADYLLLGHVVERVMDQPLAQVLKAQLFEPLGLSGSYLFCDPGDRGPRGIKARRLAGMRGEVLRPARALASLQGHGGLVSTAFDMVRLVRASFDGDIYPHGAREATGDWFGRGNGVATRAGYDRYGDAQSMLSRHFGAREIGPLYGKASSTGAFAFFAPLSGITIAGSFNQHMRGRDVVERVVRMVGLAQRDDFGAEDLAPGLSAAKA